MAGLLLYPSANLTNSRRIDYLAGDRLGTNITAANAYTASAVTWTEMAASLPEDVAGFEVSGGSGAGVVHLAAGSVGNEVIFGSFIIQGNGIGSGHFIPIPQPAGTRISMGIVRGTATANFTGSLMAVRAADMPAASTLTNMDVGCVNFAANDTQGVGITPTVANTKTAWVEMSHADNTGNILNGASLSYQYKYLGLQYKMQGRADLDQFSYLVDVAYGPAASETVVVEDYAQHIFRYQYTSNHGPIIWFPWNRPAGDRISIRMQIDKIIAGDSDSLQFYLYGLR